MKKNKIKISTKLGAVGFVFSLIALPLLLVLGLGVILSIMAVILCTLQLFKKRTKLAVAGLIIGLLPILILTVVAFNVYDTIQERNRLDFYDCGNELDTFGCFYEKFIDCGGPSTNGIALHIVGERKDRCLVLLTGYESTNIDYESIEEGDSFSSFDISPLEKHYKCYFPFSYLNEFKTTDYDVAFDKMTNLIINLKDNKYCEEFGILSMAFGDMYN